MPLRDSLFTPLEVWGGFFQKKKILIKIHPPYREKKKEGKQNFKKQFGVKEKREERSQGETILNQSTASPSTSHSWNKRPLRSCGLRELIEEVQEIICLKERAAKQRSLQRLPRNVECWPAPPFHTAVLP